jgi:hypothetical protein
MAREQIAFVAASVKYLLYQLLSRLLADFRIFYCTWPELSMAIKLSEGVLQPARTSSVRSCNGPDESDHERMRGIEVQKREN